MSHRTVLDAAVELNLDFWCPDVADLTSAELAVIPGAGHLPSMERPEETAALVRRFHST
jgi:pimeloyl-ACP methyl ester carboxylesterase